MTLASYPTTSSKSSSPWKNNVFARTRKPICCLFLAWCLFRLTEDLNTKSGQLFCSPHVLVTKAARQTVTYKVAFKLYITICTTCRNLNRKVQCVSFVCFSCFRFKYSLFFDRRRVHSVPRLERRQTCALDPSFNFKSNCTQGNRVTSNAPHKKGIFLLNVSKQQRWRSLSRRGRGGGGAHQRVFYTRVFPLPLTDGYAMLKNPNKGETAVHGCHYTNLTAAWLAQLGERRSAECVFR